MVSQAGIAIEFPAAHPPALIDCNSDTSSSLQQAIPSTGASDLTEAKAVWLTRDLLKWPGAEAGATFKLYYSANGQLAVSKGKLSGADGWLALTEFTASIPPSIAQRFKYTRDGVVLNVAASDVGRLPELHRGQILLAREDDKGKLQNVTALQVAGALDDQFAEAGMVADLGVTVNRAHSLFKLWAPTANHVALCLYESSASDATALDPMLRDEATGLWSVRQPADLTGKYYSYLVDVFVPGVGVVRNRVTDPYSISLGLDSKRSYIADLGDTRLKPPGWDTTAAPARVAAQTDMVIYELHVRDFSINDDSVPTAHRGKYLAFTDVGSHGMQHLRALSDAGMTDVHLLPVFDFATVPESGCVTPTVSGGPDSETQQATVMASAANDCFNWGYDPFHFNAPEGSYASDAADGAVRVREFRQMVMALHRAGLRVGMDVVYNHLSASGQGGHSTLDRIVPGYYLRLNERGGVEHSTCCANTATENLMMGKLMIDSAVLWATQYEIDSFRFDLMAHQPRSVMEALHAQVNLATGREVNLIGEGWNFGEVANGARFVQASQLSLGGSGIGTFSDRGRDAVRGGRACDSGEAMISQQGYINGLVYAPNAKAGARPLSDLLQTADMVRVGLAGSIRDYPLTTASDERKTLDQIAYNSDPAGYATQPSEVVNYVENHDNQTLFDANIYKLPLTTSSEDRARVQMLGAAINAFSQGVAYFHAGIDTLRSKSLDRNSFDSGDWFNRLDWNYADNYFATGLPPRQDNGKDYDLMRPLLRNAGIKPSATDIRFARDQFRDLLRIRASSSLFRLRSAAEIKSRLVFYNTGSQQNPVVLAGHLDGSNLDGAGFRELLYLVNVDLNPQSIVVPEEKGKAYVLHPVHTSPTAADPRPLEARYEAATGRFTVPARTALVWVVN
jgi:pullulanase/glycogen debranching enzyme